MDEKFGIAAAAAAAGRHRVDTGFVRASRSTRFEIIILYFYIVRIFFSPPLPSPYRITIKQTLFSRLVVVRFRD